MIITELFEATQKEDVKKIQEILGNVNDQKKFMDEINTSKNEAGEYILHVAAKTGNTEILKLITNLPGINLNVTNSRGATALFYTTVKGNIESLRHFLSLPGLTQVDKNNAFLIACTDGNLDIVNEFYKDKEININYKGSEGVSPLIMAIRNGHLPIVKSLLEKNDIDVNQTTDAGATALMMATLLKKPDIVAALLNHPKTNPLLTILQNNTAFDFAIAPEKPEIIKLFLEQPNINQEIKQRMLLSAIEKDKVDIVKEILKDKNLDINFQTTNGLTPLMLATTKNLTKMVEVFVGDPRTDKTIKNNDNKTAKDIAEERNLSQAFKLLGGEPFSQDVILNKCKKYLEVQANRRKDVYTQAAIDEVISKMMPGECSGLSGLWLYKQSQGLEEQFFGFIKLINDWDETAESLDAGKTNKEAGFMESVFEGMINDMRMLQIANRDPLMRYVKSQTHLTDVFEMMKESRLGPTVAREFSLSFILKQDELKEVLTNVMNEGKMVKIDGPNHAMAAMYKKPKFIAYDSNSVVGQKTFDTLDALQAYIEKSVITTLGFKNDKMPLTIAVFDRNHRKPHPYKETGAEMVERFITRNDDVNRRQSGNFSSLTFATERDDTGVVRTLLKSSGIEINIPNSLGATPLSLAVDNGNFEIVEDLIKHPGIDLTHKNIFGENAVFIAFQGGYLDIAEKLLNAVSPTEVSHQNNGGNTALIKSLSNKHYDACKLLLNYHKNKKGDIGLNKKTNLGWAALHIVAESGNTEIIHQMLQLEDLDVNIKSNTNLTPLMMAVIHGRTEAAKLLATSKNLDFMAKDNNLQNALMMAVVYKKIDSIHFLLENFKYNLSDKDTEGNTVLDLAIKTQDPQIIKKIASHPDIPYKDVLALMKSAQRKSPPDANLVTDLASAKNINLNSPWVKTWLGIENLENKPVLDLAHPEPVTTILKDFGVNVNSPDKSGLDILLTLAAEGYSDIVTGILSATHLNTQDIAGYTPLMLAIAKDQLDFVKILTKCNNVDFSITNKMNQNALSLAISLGKADMVQALLNTGQFKLNERDIDGNTIFDLAIAGGDPDVITNVASSSSSAECWYQMMMASHRGDTSVIELLAKAKGFNVQDPWIELMLAVTRGDVDAVKKSLEEKCDINEQDPNGATALMFAVSLGHVEITKLLLSQSQINLSLQDDDDMTALDFATRLDDPQLLNLILETNKTSSQDLWNAFLMANYEGNQQATALLAQHGKIDVQQDLWVSILLDIQTNQIDKVKQKLLTSEIDIKRRDPNGDTLMLFASELGNVEAVRALLTYTKPDLNQKNNQGKTPLMIAAKYNNVELAQLLLNAGADPSIKDTKGKTAQEIADDYENTEIEDLIKKASLKSQDSKPAGPALTLGYQLGSKITSSTPAPEPLSKKPEGPPKT